MAMAGKPKLPAPPLEAEESRRYNIKVMMHLDSSFKLLSSSSGGGETPKLNCTSTSSLINVQFRNLLPVCCLPDSYSHDENRASLFAVDTESGMLINTDNGSPIAQVGAAAFVEVPNQQIPNKSYKVFQGGNVGHLHKLPSVESSSQMSIMLHRFNRGNGVDEDDDIGLGRIEVSKCDKNKNYVLCVILCNAYISWDLLRTHIFPKTQELPQFPISPKPLFISKNRLRNLPKPFLKQNLKTCTYAQFFFGTYAKFLKKKVFFSRQGLYLTDF
ncbi:hypothetical protein LXL04_015667 [Taraxacum kok-saghyz]